MRWDDDPNFANVKKLSVPEEVLQWTPDIRVLSSSNGNEYILSKGKRVQITPDGTITWFPTGRLTTVCKIYLRLFPFDTQICDLHIESWTYQTHQMELIPPKHPAFLRLRRGFIENSIWTIVSNDTIHGRKKWSDDFCFTFVVFRLVLKRKPLYQIIYIVLPSMIIGASETVVFYLPYDDTTRVEISVTCLLAYVVFQSMIIQSIPKSIGSIPLLSLFIDLQMAYIGLIAIIGDAIVFSIINCDFHSGPPSPKLMEIVVSVGRRLGFKSNFIQRKLVIDVIEDTFEVQSVEDSDFISMKKIIDHWRRFTAKKLLKKQWQFIGQVLQRIILIIYSTLVISTPIAMLVASYVLTEEYELRNHESDCY